MGLYALLWGVSLAVGILLQRRLRDPGRLTRLLFLATFWGTTPLVVFFSYSTVTIDHALVAAMAVAIVASWLMLGVGLGWGRLAARDRAEDASLALGTAMGNTSIVGYPLAALLFGPSGLALAVVYAEFQFLIPPLAVSTGIARRYAPGGTTGAKPMNAARMVRGWLINPPVIAGLTALALRVAGADLASVVEPIGPAAAWLIGLLGFVQLGLAAPLGRISHGALELGRAGVTMLLRSGACPLVLVAIGALAGVHVPGAFVLLAATPVAFHTMVLARVYRLDLEMQRLLIVVSTPLVIGAVLAWHALA